MCNLFEEPERANDRRLLCLASADINNADDFYDSQNNDENEVGYRNDDRPEEECGNKSEEPFHHNELRGLTHVEHGEFRIAGNETNNDNSKYSEKVGEQCVHLVVGDILRAELGRVVFGVNSRIEIDGVRLGVCLTPGIDGGIWALGVCAGAGA